MNQYREKSIVWINYIITTFFYLAYLGLVVFLAVQHDPMCLPIIVTCAVPFFLVSVFRHFYFAPRPGEKDGITPLIKKRNKNSSFPSRHVFSAFIIAVSFLRCFPVCGVILLLLAGALAFLRVRLGVHYVRDVVAGAIIALVCGFIGLWLIF